MADMAPATPANEARRTQMLRAAAELIAERGFGETRIADVAKRARASSALVIYYFGTRDRLLVDALRYSEQNFYDAAKEMWFDLWAQAFRHPEVKQDRVELDARWRSMIVDIVKAGQADATIAAKGPGKVDPYRFALTFAALLDGLSIQVALEDPDITPEVAYRIAMSFAERELGLSPARRRKRA
jgi:AcrR family transcriptional regulator